MVYQCLEMVGLWARSVSLMPKHVSEWKENTVQLCTYVADQKHCELHRSVYGRLSEMFVSVDISTVCCARLTSAYT